MGDPPSRLVAAGPSPLPSPPSPPLPPLLRWLVGRALGSSSLVPPGRPRGDNPYQLSDYDTLFWAPGGGTVIRHTPPPLAPLTQPAAAAERGRSARRAPHDGGRRSSPGFRTVLWHIRSLCTVLPRATPPNPNPFQPYPIPTLTNTILMPPQRVPTRTVLYCTTTCPSSWVLSGVHHRRDVGALEEGRGNERHVAVARCRHPLQRLPRIHPCSSLRGLNAMM